MKATELRIGNLVWLKGVKMLHKVSASSLYQGIAMDCDPIPLTEEILLKCGFKVVSPTCEGYNNQSYSRWENTIQIVLKDGSFNLWIDSEDEWYSFAWVKITSLHQLQNLYFALTVEELTVKL